MATLAEMTPQQQEMTTLARKAITGVQRVVSSDGLVKLGLGRKRAGVVCEGLARCLNIDPSGVNIFDDLTFVHFGGEGREGSKGVVEPHVILYRGEPGTRGAGKLYADVMIGGIGQELSFKIIPVPACEELTVDGFTGQTGHSEYHDEGLDRSRDHTLQVEEGEDGLVYVLDGFSTSRRGGGDVIDVIDREVHRQIGLMPPLEDSSFPGFSRVVVRDGRHHSCNILDYGSLPKPGLRNRSIT
jgi:hypothetical protein